MNHHFTSILPLFDLPQEKRGQHIGDVAAAPKWRQKNICLRSYRHFGRVISHICKLLWLHHFHFARNERKKKSILQVALGPCGDAGSIPSIIWSHGVRQHSNQMIKCLKSLICQRPREAQNHCKSSKCKCRKTNLKYISIVARILDCITVIEWQVEHHSEAAEFLVER